MKRVNYVLHCSLGEIKDYFMVESDATLDVIENKIQEELDVTFVYDIVLVGEEGDY